MAAHERCRICVWCHESEQEFDTSARRHHCLLPPQKDEHALENLSQSALREAVLGARSGLQHTDRGGQRWK